MTLEPSGLSSAFVTPFLPKSYLASWSIPNLCPSNLCPSNLCPSPLPLGSSISKTGISVGGTGEGRGEGDATRPHVAFHREFHQVPVLR
jgi:hypothetical protein